MDHCTGRPQCQGQADDNLETLATNIMVWDDIQDSGVTFHFTRVSTHVQLSLLAPSDLSFQFVGNRSRLWVVGGMRRGSAVATRTMTMSML